MSERFKAQFNESDDGQQVTLADRTYGTPPLTAPRRNAIVPQPNGSMVFKRFTMTSIGLLIPDNVTTDELEEISIVVGGLQSSMQWVIGDLMNSIGRTYGDGSYERYASKFHLEVKTLVEWAYVCRQVELSIRMDNLSFGHHQLVAGLAPNQQVEWLAWAAQNNKSIAEMRKAMKGNTTPAPSTALERFTRDFQAYRKGLQSLGQGEREQLRALAIDLITQIDQLGND